jgi:hypothetical protein
MPTQACLMTGVLIAMAYRMTWVVWGVVSVHAWWLSLPEPTRVQSPPVRWEGGWLNCVRENLQQRQAVHVSKYSGEECTNNPTGLSIPCTCVSMTDNLQLLMIDSLNNRPTCPAPKIFHGKKSPPPTTTTKKTSAVTTTSPVMGPCVPGTHVGQCGDQPTS